MKGPANTGAVTKGAGRGKPQPGKRLSAAAVSKAPAHAPVGPVRGGKTAQPPATKTPAAR